MAKRKEKGMAEIDEEMTAAEKKAKDQVTAAEYFKNLKENKHTITDEGLQKIQANCLALFDKYERTGQKDAVRKLYYHIATIDREHQAIAAGVDMFVYLSDIRPLLDRVEGRVVKCIDLAQYEREIPDDVVEKYERVKGIFDKFVILFTDFTKEHTKKIQKERDPILFGIFQDASTETTIERLYFIGDWEDEYCDLTLSKLVAEINVLREERNDPNREVVYKVSDPPDLDALRARMQALNKESSTGRVVSVMTNGTATGYTLVNTFQNTNNVLIQENRPEDLVATEGKRDETPAEEPKPEEPKKKPRLNFWPFNKGKWTRT